jgi:predicted dehydrogenase
MNQPTTAGARPARVWKDIGVGLISVGWMGRLHSQAYRRVGYHYPDLPVRPTLVIAADLEADRARYAVEELGYAEATTDWKDVLRHPDVEVVSVTAPNHLHREIALAAAEHRKHFWIEKPVGIDAEDARAVAEAVERVGVRTAVGFNYRHVPGVRHARELIAAGRLGQVTHVRGVFLNDYAADPQVARSWRFRRDRAGSGALGDLMSHVVDLLQHLVGPVTEVTALTRTVTAERPAPPAGGGDHFAAADGAELAPVDNEDYAAALLRFGGGPVGTAEASRVTVGPSCSIRVDVHGTDGAVSWDFERMNEVRVCLGRSGANHGYTTVLARPEHGDYARFQPGPAIAMGYDDLKVIEAAQFLRSVVTGEQLAAGVADARTVAAVLAAMERAAASGRWEPTAARREPTEDRREPTEPRRSGRA